MVPDIEDPQRSPLKYLHHVGIVVPSLEAASAPYRAAWGQQAVGPALLTEDGQIRIAFVETGATLVELLEPVGDATDLRSFLEGQPGGGLHHLCHAVTDIQAAWRWYEAQSAAFAGPIRRGILGHPIFFVRPQDGTGILTEIIEIPA